jgi:hypothetical protein
VDGLLHLQGVLEDAQVFSKELGLQSSGSNFTQVTRTPLTKFHFLTREWASPRPGLPPRGLRGGVSGVQTGAR